MDAAAPGLARRPHRALGRRGAPRLLLPDPRLGAGRGVGHRGAHHRRPEASTAPVADFDVTPLPCPQTRRQLASGVQDGPSHWTAPRCRWLAPCRWAGSRSIGDCARAAVGGGDDWCRRTGRRDPCSRISTRRCGCRGLRPPLRALSVAHLHPLRSHRACTVASSPQPHHAGPRPDRAPRPATRSVTNGSCALVGDDQARDPWLDEGSPPLRRGAGSRTRWRRRIVQIPAGAQDHAGEAMTFWDSRPTSTAGVYLRVPRRWRLWATPPASTVPCGSTPPPEPIASRPPRRSLRSARPCVRGRVEARWRATGSAAGAPRVACWAEALVAWGGQQG